MPTIQEICNDPALAINLCQCSPVHEYRINLEAVSEWLAKRGFNDFEFVGAGKASIVVRPTGKPDYVFKITDDFERDVIPQEFQAVYSTRKPGFGILHAELLGNMPDLSGNEAEQKSAIARFDNKEVSPYRNQVFSLNPADFGTFSYQDPRTNMMKHVVMGRDSGAVKGDSTEQSENYPSLEIQYQQQRDLIADHHELQSFFRQEGFESGMPPALERLRSGNRTELY